MSPAEQQIYIKKREIILKILSSLFAEWDLAQWLHALVSSVYITPEAIDGIEQILHKAISQAKNAEEKRKIEQGLQTIRDMKSIELSERDKDRKNAELETLSLGLFV